MRRIWNSWTYYGNSESTPKPKEETTRDPWQRAGWTGTDEEGHDSHGALEMAYERAMATATSNEIERAMDLSDVRGERVARVKRAIDNGTYRISARELAQRLIRNMRGDYH